MQRVLSRASFLLFLNILFKNCRVKKTKQQQIQNKIQPVCFFLGKNVYGLHLIPRFSLENLHCVSLLSAVCFVY